MCFGFSVFAGLCASHGFCPVPLKRPREFETESLREGWKRRKLEVSVAVVCLRAGLIKIIQNCSNYVINSIKIIQNKSKLFKIVPKTSKLIKTNQI